MSYDNSISDEISGAIKRSIEYGPVFVDISM